MGKIEVNNKLISRAKERQKRLKSRGINKSIFDCASDIRMEEEFKSLSSLVLKTSDFVKSNNKRKKKEGRDFFGGLA